MNLPFSVAVDAAGNLYIADSGNNRIRRVDGKGLIMTVAGDGTSGYSGDGGAAGAAGLSNPSGVAVDGSGNLFIADTGNSRIRKVDVHGLITTVAGDGTSGYSGDGAAATNATLNGPAGVAVDAAGNLLIADTGNSVIRKVDINGVISTVAGNGSGGFSGDSGAATNASLGSPQGVAVDAAGNVFIADARDQRIREVDTNGIITTVAGNPWFSWNWWFGEWTGGYSGDGGAATNAMLDGPAGVAVGVSGDLFIADSANNRIRLVEPIGGPSLRLPDVSTNDGGNYRVIVTSPFGSVTSSVATVTVLFPPAIITPPENASVPVGGAVSFTVAATGTQPLFYAWYFNGTNLVEAGTNSMLSLSNVDLAVAGDYAVVISNLGGSVVSAAAQLSVGYPPTITSQPGGQTVLLGGNVRLQVAVAGTDPIAYQWQLDGVNLPSDFISTVAGDGSGGFSGDGGAATLASLDWPTSVALDGSGDLFIANTVNNRIRKVEANGIITTVAGNGSFGYSGDGGAATNATLSVPYGVALDAVGNLFIADQINQRIRKVDPNGIISTVAGNGSEGYSGDGGAATNASLSLPSGVAVDGVGNFFIADTGNSRIRKVGVHGIITTVAGNGSSGYSGDGSAATNAMLSGPSGVAVDAGGNLFVADIGNSLIRKVDLNGVISTVAGSGSSGDSGDGSAATNAMLNGPSGVAVDGSGNLFIADTGNSVIRQVNTNGVITTVAGNGSGGYSGDGGAATNASLDSPSGTAVDDSGNLYVADSGNDGIRVVALAGGPTLKLSNVAATDGGNYQVIVTSPYGSITSAVATLTPVLLPLNVTFEAGPVVRLTSSATPGSTYVLEAAPDLNAPINWQPICTNVADPNGQWSFLETNALNYAARFYRLELVTCVPPPSGLVSWWPADGNANDIVGGNNGILVGGVTFAEGEVGEAFKFDGTSGFISTSSFITNLQVFTLSLWFRTATELGGVLMSFDSSQTALAGSSYDRNIYMDDAGALHFGVWNPGPLQVNSAAGYNDNLWHQAVGSLSASTGLTFYLDGVLVGNNPAATIAQIYNGYWRIGEDNLNNWPFLPSSYYFKGQIDEVAIFNRVLSPAEVAAFYAAGKYGMCR